MSQGVGIVERAFELIEACGSVNEVRRKLKAEGYFDVDSHLGSKRLRMDLEKRLAAKAPD